MSHPVPKFISKQYKGGARGFRREKRRQLRELNKALNALRKGCMYFPSGARHVHEISLRIAALFDDLSRKNWGQ